MRTLYLYGHLAEVFGDRLRLNVRSIAEAIRALEANFPGRVISAFRNGSYHVVRGDRFDNGTALDESQVLACFPSGDFHIVPAIEGSGGNSKGILTAILGVALIAIAVFAAPLAIAGGQAFSLGVAAIPGGIMNVAVAGGLGATAFAGISFGQIFLAGASLLFSGISSVLAKTPEAADVEDRVESSFVRDLVGLGAEGGPVPFAYGEILARPFVVSSGISAEVV